MWAASAIADVVDSAGSPKGLGQCERSTRIEDGARVNELHQVSSSPPGVRRKLFSPHPKNFEDAGDRQLSETSEDIIAKQTALGG